MTSVRLELDPPVATVVLSRPAKKNAVDRATARALSAALREANAAPGVRAVVLWGEGGTFCAGADLAALDNDLAPFPADGPMGPSRGAGPKPLVAAVEGHAVAGGLELALLADLRVAAEDATMGVFCRRWGVPLVDGGTVRLPRVVGEGRAADLVLTGRAVGAAEALAMGLVNRVAPRGGARAAAEALAREIAAHPHECVLADLASLRAQSGRPAADAMRDEFARATAAPGVLDGMRAGARRFAAGGGRRAVLFDLGGVVLESPMEQLAMHSALGGLPPEALNRLLGGSGAWEELECGRLTLEQFYEPFAAELREAGAGGRVDPRALFRDVGSVRARVAMVRAVAALRRAGYRVGALTNNWTYEGIERSPLRRMLARLFDVVVESRLEGVRKPDPRIYRVACERLGVRPGETVFLDDIGRNLKAARALGMATVRVRRVDKDGLAAVAELAGVLGWPGLVDEAGAEGAGRGQGVACGPEDPRVVEVLSKL